MNDTMGLGLLVAILGAAAFGLTMAAAPEWKMSRTRLVAVLFMAIGVIMIIWGSGGSPQ